MSDNNGSAVQIAVSAHPRIIDDEIVAWAIATLSMRVGALGIGVVNADSEADALAVALVESSDSDRLAAEGIQSGEAPQAAESYLMDVRAGASGQSRVVIVAPDPVGFSYAITELASRIVSADGLDAVAESSCESEHPSVPVRGIVRSFSSVDEDSTWFHDRAFWTEYLDYLASQRFNRFHLAFGMQYNYGADKHGGTDNYLCFIYPFLFDVDGFNVRAEGVSDAERHRNLEALKFVARETKRRGMRFQLGLWNHAYDYGRDSDHRYPILGVSDETHADYSAAGLAKLLRECPDIDGLTFRVHYEGGIHDDGHEIFWDKLFTAISAAGRPLEVDMHSKGVDQALLDAVAKPGISAVLSGKYWAEHMGLPYHQTSIRAREAAQPLPPGHAMQGITEFSRRFTRYGYGDFLSEDRTVDFMFRVWPGTQKLLLWGDPAIASGYGRYSTFGGARGVDFCEPLFFKGRKGTGESNRRDPYVRDDLRLAGREWHKYRYTYLLWGRLLYNPDASPETWRRFLRAEYGVAADSAEEALASLSRILPLVTVVHGVGGSNNGYWPEVYVNLPISAWVHSDHYDSDTPEPKNWGGVSPFDPTMFYNVNEYVRDALADTIGAKYTPLEVASWIDGFVATGETALVEFRATADGSEAQVARTLIDLDVLVRLGRFFAGKFRAAVDYAVFEATGDRGAIESVVSRYEEAREAYSSILDVVDGVYQDDLKFGSEYSEHGHWAMRIQDIDDDLRAVRLERDRAAAGIPQEATQIAHRESRLPIPSGVRHEVPPAYVRGEPLRIALDVPDASGIEGVTLRYRHVDQSETFREVPMTRAAGSYEATIGAAYLNSPYPLMYFFELSPRADAPLVYPGFVDTLSNQPYIVINSTRWNVTERVQKG